MLNIARDAARYDIYWANTFFSEADRIYNECCVARLRDAGYDVFMPQETTTNALTEPTALDIFRTDTAALLDSRCVIACIDQESIDPGVACEIGLAYAFGLPIVSLCTDLRQFRKGRFRLYRNPYVVGLLERTCAIQTSLDAVIALLPTVAGVHTLDDGTVSHFDAFASSYDGLVDDLETWQSPAVNWDVLLDQHCLLEKRSILEVGCGTGRLARALHKRRAHLDYTGYDPALRMIEEARARLPEWADRFLGEQCAVERRAAVKPFDVGLAFFMLHDVANRREFLSWLAGCLSDRASLVIVDLSLMDLPRATQALRKELGRPALVVDCRLSLGTLLDVCTASGFNLGTCQVLPQSVTFPDSDALDRYFGGFGIYSGHDLPLGLREGAVCENREQIRRITGEWSFPYTDRREYLACTFLKGGSS